MKKIYNCEEHKPLVPNQFFSYFCRFNENNVHKIIQDSYVASELKNI